MHVWTGLIWLRIWTNGGLLWIREWTFGAHKMLRNSWVAAQLAASWEGLSSMELVSYNESIKPTHRSLNNTDWNEMGGICSTYRETRCIQLIKQAQSIMQLAQISTGARNIRRFLAGSFSLSK
jgi:hypothetical protein